MLQRAAARPWGPCSRSLVHSPWAPAGVMLQRAAARVWGPCSRSLGSLQSLVHSPWAPAGVMLQRAAARPWAPCSRSLVHSPWAPAAVVLQRAAARPWGPCSRSLGTLRPLVHSPWAPAAVMLQRAAASACGPCSRSLGSLRTVASVTVQPPGPGLADEPLGIRVQGLSPLQQVTLRALVQSDRETLFDSCAHYQADRQGSLDLARDPSTGGQYTGVQPMGLLWTLSPASLEHPYDRLEKREVLKTPLVVEVLVHKGHSAPKQIPGQVMAQVKVERWWTAPGVQRFRLREGAVRGSLFLPPGDGPFPGVIDMFGDEGGLLEYRSSLLASRGFAALALPYFGFEDLPTMMKDFHLEYFEAAARFLQRHPKVKGLGVGVIGTGKGADLALSMITFLPEVVAAVSISGCCSNTAADLHYGGQILPGLRYNMDKVCVSDSAVFDVSESLGDPTDPANCQSIIPLEKAEGHLLFVVGEDDRNWKSSLYAQIAIQRLQQHGKGNFQLLSYPGAGHRIDPPCSPFCLAATDRLLEVPILGGGDAQAHCRAQVHSWEKIQEFLNLHLR